MEKILKTPGNYHTQRRSENDVRTSRFCRFPGTQGGPLEHVIAAKAVAFGEALDDSFKDYQLQVKKCGSYGAGFMDKGYKVVSGGRIIILC